jgi:hypothetical protein
VEEAAVVAAVAVEEEAAKLQGRYMTRLYLRNYPHRTTSSYYQLC